MSSSNGYSRSSAADARNLQIEPTEVVSGHAYLQILASPPLREDLYPEGLFPGPYEILDYFATLNLEDPDGKRATFRRTQTIRFLQEGVSAILDHAWGDGVLSSYYHTDAGKVEGSISDGNRRHFIIRLHHRMKRGDALTFQVQRTAMVGFMADQEWLETTIDHPIRRLRRRIVFPPQRKCQRAELEIRARRISLEPAQRRGRTLVDFTARHPLPHMPYTVRWTW
jgi:hypothetical protein